MSPLLLPNNHGGPVPEQVPEQVHSLWSHSHKVMPELNGDLPKPTSNQTTPKMILSQEHNPLTAKLAPPTSILSPQHIATLRFAVKGNVLITGGAGSLGLAAARALLQHGAKAVTLWDRTDNVFKHIDLISEPNVYSISGDLTDEQIIKTNMEAVYRRMGSIDHLLCFAGMPLCVHSEGMSSIDFQRILNINLTASFVCAREAFRYMKSDGNGGSILLIASISAHATNYPQPQVAYNASKAAVISMTKSLAAEWATYGVRVNSISPGYMDTQMNEGSGLTEARNIWASRCPMGRMGDPEELTGAVVLLCSERGGRYMTGTDIIVDGGALCF